MSEEDHSEKSDQETLSVQNTGALKAFLAEIEEDNKRVGGNRSKSESKVKPVVTGHQIAEKIYHPTLDSFTDNRNARILIGKNEPPSLASKVEEKIYQGIMAKMSIRRVDVEKHHPNNRTGLKSDVIADGGKLKSLSDRVPAPAREDTYSRVSSGIINDIYDLLWRSVSDNTVNTNIEIEASFGIFRQEITQKFEPGIKSGTDFSNLKAFLMVHTDPIFDHKITEDVVEIMEDNKGSIRCIINSAAPQKRSWERKQRHASRDNSVIIQEFGVRITRSVETVKVPKIPLDEWRPTLRRERSRTSFRGTKGQFSDFVIDITKVYETKIVWNDGLAVPGDAFLKTEVEIEFSPQGASTSEGSTRITAKNFAKIIEFVYAALVTNLVPYKFSEPMIFDTLDRAYVVKLHNTLFEEIIRSRGNNYHLPNNKYAMFDGSYWNKPINIKLSALKANEKGFALQNATAAVKHNGKRFFLLMVRKVCWLLWPPYTVVKYGTINDASYDGTYIDGELEPIRGKNGEVLDYTFYAFDILFFKGSNIQNKSFNARFALVADCVSVITPFFGTITPQTYFEGDSIYERIKNAYSAYVRAIEKDPESADGIIIQAPFKYYTLPNLCHLTTFKWKPEEQLTIDFKVTRAPQSLISSKSNPTRITKKDIDRAFVLKVKNGKVLEPFTPTSAPGYDGIMILTPKEMKSFTGVNEIVECKWNPQLGQFIPIKVREDKPHPNSKDAATDVWKDIHNPVKISTLTGNDFTMLRKRHNEIKKGMLEKYVTKGSVIVDIGSGRGGDLGKWRDVGIKKVFAIEPSFNEKKKDKFSVNTRGEFNRRLGEEQKHKDAPEIKMIKYGIEETSQIKAVLKKTKIDVVVAFFSLTFLTETKDKFEAFIDTINSIIPVGGKFIGTVMDGMRVYNLLQKTGKLQSMTTSELRDLMKRVKDDHVNIMSSEYGVEIDIDKDYILAEMLARSQPNYEEFDPTVNPLIFDTNAFTIEQSGREGFAQDIIDDPYANQIDINIHDPTSMVKYTEWLFIYDNFKKNLVDIGFEEKSSYFLDDPQVRYLPKDSFVFSALNRSFVFERISK